MVKILLVEDDPAVAEVICYFLKEKNYRVLHARDAAEVFALSEERIDLVLLDILLPGQDGFDICKRFRENNDCPIIFLSCLDDSDSIIHALGIGGDDYLTKPFDENVLLARIEANLRRVKRLNNEKAAARLYACRGFSLDTGERCIRKGEGKLLLTTLEYQLLLFFMQHPLEFFSSDELYRRIWQKDSYGDVRAVLVHIHGIRKKIEPRPAEPMYLVRKRGHGYIFYPDGLK